VEGVEGQSGRNHRNTVPPWLLATSTKVEGVEGQRRLKWNGRILTYKNLPRKPTALAVGW